jgi:hypothetical protein
LMMVSAHRRPEAYAAFTVPGRLALRIPVATRTRVTRIVGDGRVTGVELENLDTHARRFVDCDTVVVTGDWIPDNELARAAGLDLDAHTRGPLIDTRQATSTPGVFAIGNLTHPVDTADIAALDGAAVADQVLTYLSTEQPSTASDGMRIVPGAHLKWISPGRYVAGATAPPRQRLLAWPTHEIRFPTVTVRQRGSDIARRRLPWPASPGRVLRIPFAIVRNADPAGGDVTVDVT